MLDNKPFWSCSDLQNSAYLAPSQVRACCQRFFVNGKQEGDVILLDTEKGDLVSSEAILNAKQSLIRRINNKEKTACFGCPYLQRDDWEPIEKLELKHLSLEYHSVCNLKCTYCSEEYYGGKLAQYDIKELITQFKNQGVLDGCDSVVWGGGEPVLDPDFESILALIMERIAPKYLRFFTNSVRHNAILQELIDKEKIFITTSIDAGSRSAYKSIRGFDRLDKVYVNLRKYASVKPERLTIKYIFTDGNVTSNEISSFIEYIKLNELRGCNFQISFDFTKEVIEKSEYLCLIELYSKLQELKVYSVFLDDLIWQRLSANVQDDTEVLNELATSGLIRSLATANSNDKIVIWGTGSMADFLVEKSSFFRRFNLAYFVAGNSMNSPLGTEELKFGKRIYQPSKLLLDDSRIVIAAAQQFPVILKEIESLGIPKSRIISGIVL